MKNMKKLIAAAAIAGILGAAGTAFAAVAQTPADIVSGLTGKSVEEVTTERGAGTTYGSIAKEAGKLADFQTQMLEQKKAILDQRVLDGQLTQDKADEVYNAIKDNQVNCDANGSAGIGKRSGVGFGQGLGMGMGMGRGAGQRNGGGFGGGMDRGSGLNK